jgi:hypothetical protein
MLFGGGGGGLIDFRDAFREALNSPEIQAIVLDVDSPGRLRRPGAGDRPGDLRRARREADRRGREHDGRSAAYWIASQADEVVVTPSGEVGSIGVYMLHEDWSKFNEEIGVDPTYIFAGRTRSTATPTSRSATPRAGVAAGGRRPLRHVRRRRRPRPRRDRRRGPAATARAARCSPPARSRPASSTASTRSRRSSASCSRPRPAAAPRRTRGRDALSAQAETPLRARRARAGDDLSRSPRPTPARAGATSTGRPTPTPRRTPRPSPHLSRTSRTTKSPTTARDEPRRSAPRTARLRRRADRLTA